MGRESLLVSTLVELADNLVTSYDVIDVLTTLSDRCVQVIDVSAAGVMLAPPGGELQFVASSSESMRVLELFQIQANEGPCVDCVADGVAIVNYALEIPDTRWPRFTPTALAHGFVSVDCLPMRLRGRTIGGLNLFRSDFGVLRGEDVIVAQGFADVATIAILQHQTMLNARTLNEQLGSALNSRIVIEQAKGMVRQAAQCEMEVAFTRLRGHARNHNQRLTDVATAIVERVLSVSELDPLPSTRAT
jgi:GAF domain-containing protein